MGGLGGGGGGGVPPMGGFRKGGKVGSKKAKRR
jgi:hypothetical protein